MPNNVSSRGKLQLWSVSTTMRNPQRTLEFLRAAKELEGSEWTHETQMRLQAILLKNRAYTPGYTNLNEDQINKLEDLQYQLSEAEARDIFNSVGYEDPPMRGRTSFSPLMKLGLAVLDKRDGVKYIKITGLGNDFLNGRIELPDVISAYLFKLQFSNELGFPGFNTKPFINAIRLIKKVNELCIQNGDKPKGVSVEEFSIFALSIKDYRDVDTIAEKLISFRNRLQAIDGYEDKCQFIDGYTLRYLHEFNNPIKNTKEYVDNIVRYLRLTKYIYFRGNGNYIDLEPRRAIEIDEILAHDIGCAKQLTKGEYEQYMADITAYTLPFETKEKLQQIANSIIDEINQYERELIRPVTSYVLPIDIKGLKKAIDGLREVRAKLQNLFLRNDYQDITLIDKAIDDLGNIKGLGIKPSIALEKMANIALNIIDDAQLIKPNAPLGDDNEPIFTAPGGVADIECFYRHYGLICEVTMLTSRDQWFNEGQPVMRHLRDFENEHSGINYCLFIAPKLHEDTLNTFWISVKYEYAGQKQKIIPLTIGQLIEIIVLVKHCRERGYILKESDIKRLYDMCADVTSLNSSIEWKTHIKNSLSVWKDDMVQACADYNTLDRMAAEPQGGM